MARIIAGNRIYDTCAMCGKMVQINKWLGGLHFCLSPKEIVMKREYERQVQAQMTYQPSPLDDYLKGFIGKPNQTNEE